MRILIVDDDFVSRTQLKAMLAPHGDCDTVDNGELALTIFQRAHQEGTPYGLITMDINMPDLNGHEVVRRLRKWENENRSLTGGFEARVLMITCMDDPKEIMGSFRNGAEWFLTKPITPDKIAEALGKLDFTSQRANKPAPEEKIDLLPWEQAVAAQAQAVKTRPPAPKVETAAAQADSPDTDWMGDPRQVSFEGVDPEFWSDYATSTAAMLEELEEAAMRVDNGEDVEESSALIMRKLHSLKGEAGMIGLMDVNRVIHETETRFGEQGGCSESAEMVLAVKDWVEAAVACPPEHFLAGSGQ